MLDIVDSVAYQIDSSSKGIAGRVQVLPGPVVHLVVLVMAGHAPLGCMSSVRAEEAGCCSSPDSVYSLVHTLGTGLGVAGAGRWTPPSVIQVLPLGHSMVG
jgi:hypothetical protein